MWVCWSSEEGQEVYRFGRVLAEGNNVALGICVPL